MANPARKATNKTTTAITTAATTMSTPPVPTGPTERFSAPARPFAMPSPRADFRGRAPGKALRLCVGEVAVVSLAHVVESGVESSNGGHRPLPAFPRGGLLRQVTLDGLAYDLGDG